MAAVEAPLPAAGGPLGPPFGADVLAELEALDWAAMGLCLSEFPDFGSFLGAAPSGCPPAAAEDADGAFGSFLSSLLDDCDDGPSEDLPELQDKLQSKAEELHCKAEELQCKVEEKVPRAGSPSSGESTVTKDEARKIRNRKSAATSRERQKARAATERVRLESLERENSSLRQQLEGVIQENGELRSMLASYTSGASKGKENQGPVESAELNFGNLLPLGSQPEHFPLRAAPLHSGPPTSCLRPWQSLTSQSPAGPAKGPGRERARTAPPPSAVMGKFEMGQPVTSHPRPAPLRLLKEFSTQDLGCRTTITPSLQASAPPRPLPKRRVGRGSKDSLQRQHHGRLSLNQHLQALGVRPVPKTP